MVGVTQRVTEIPESVCLRVGRHPKRHKSRHHGCLRPMGLHRHHMKKIFIIIAAVFILSMALLSGCKLFIDQDERVQDTCYIFDAGVKGNSYKLSSVLSRDFVFVPNEVFINEFALTGTSMDRDTFSGFVNQGIFKNDGVVAFSNIIVSGINASADMQYFDLNYNMFLEVSLRDEGDFIFDSNWKVINLYVRDIKIYMSTSVVSGISAQ